MTKVKNNVFRQWWESWTCLSAHAQHQYSPLQGLAHSGKGSLLCLLYQTALSFTQKCEKSATDHKAFKDFKENQQHERGAQNEPQQQHMKEIKEKKVI